MAVISDKLQNDYVDACIILLHSLNKKTNFCKS